MTTGEALGIVGVVSGILVNVSALVWGAAKMSSRVDQATTTAREIRNDFRAFLKNHEELEKTVQYHSVAIALICNETGVKIRRSDLGVQTDD